MDRDVWGDPERQHVGPIVADGLCTMCGMCVAVCPQGSISMSIDSNRGLYVPAIDFGKCTNCGICYRVCPGREVVFYGLGEVFLSNSAGESGSEGMSTEISTHPYVGQYVSCYAGYASDETVRLRGASGGVVSALMIYLLEKEIVDGVFTTRMRSGRPLETETFIARNRDEILNAAGSKYAPVAACAALAGSWEEGDRFAFVGLPCHIHGVRKAQSIDGRLHEELLLVSIFCGNGASFCSTERTLSEHGISPADVQRIDYRSEGWPGAMRLQLGDGGVRLIDYFDFYNAQFVALSPVRCTLCSDGTGELADIACGDAWLPEYAGEQKGVSVIVTRTMKGESLVRQAITDGVLDVRPITVDKVYESQRALLDKKKRRIQANFALFTMLGKRVPKYNQRLDKPNWSDYINAVLFYVTMFIARHRSLRFLFGIFSLLKALRRLACRLVARARGRVYLDRKLLFGGVSGKSVSEE